VVNGRPSIAYYDNDSNRLMFVRADDSTGVNWGTPVELDSADDVGRYPSLAVVNGKPAVSYYDATNYDLKFVRADDISGATWQDPLILDDGSYIGMFTSLAVINGLPTIAYHRNEFDASWVGNLCYIQALDISGATWDLPVELDTEGNVGTGLSLALVNGYLGIAYYDAGFDALKYALVIK
jgi:hypothetical protein